MSQMKVRLKRRRVLELLSQKNMSQNSFGRDAKLSSGHVSQLLRGKRNVSPDTRVRILGILGVTFGEIFTTRISKR